MVNVAIHGAAGRMGKRLIALGHSAQEIELVAAVELDSHPELGQDAGRLAGLAEIGLPLSTEFPEQVDVVIDFSLPSAVDEIVRICRQRSTAVVIATTGLSAATEDGIREASQQIPIVWAPNMSLAVNLTMKLTEVVAAALKQAAVDVDVEIIETHHRFKADAPSGTALKFGELIGERLGIDRHQHGRHGDTGVRPRDEIGYHAVRAGDDAGRHTILFGMLGEKIEVGVAASNRDCYASGALMAARFLHGKPAGLYSMYDVLGL